MNSSILRFINKYILPCYFLLFVAILAVRDFTGMQVSQLFMLAYVSILILFADYKSLTYYTALLMPMLCGIFLFLIAFLYLGIIFKAPKKPNKFQIGFAVVLILIEALDQLLLATQLRTYDITRIILYGSFLLTTFYFVFLPDGLINRKCFVRCYCYGTFFTLAIILCSTIIQWGFLHLFTGYRMGNVSDYDVYSESQAMFGLNSNNLAYYSLYTLATLLVGRKKMEFNSLIYWILIIGTCCIGILSYSRTFILLTAFLILLTMLTSFNIKKIIAGICIVVGVESYALMEFEGIEEGYLNRFVASDVRSGGDRTSLFSHYNDFFVSNPELWLLGTGVVYYKDVCKQENSIHNATQQIYVTTGIVGLLIFALSIYVFFKGRMVRGVHTSYYLPAMAVFLFLQTLQVLNPMELMCPITLASMTLCIGAEEKKQILSIRKKYENRLINVS